MIVEKINKNGWSVSSLGDGAFWSFRDLMMTWGSCVTGGRQTTHKERTRYPLVIGFCTDSKTDTVGATFT